MCVCAWHHPFIPPSPFPSSSRLPVKGGERAVIFNRIGGIKENSYGEGTHLMLPWFERPIIFEVRTRPRQIQSLTGSKGVCACVCVCVGAPLL